MIKTEYYNGKIEINKSETLRYLGNAPFAKAREGCGCGGEIVEIAEAAIKEVGDKTLCRACFEYFPIAFVSDESADLGFAKTESKNLIKNLCGCGGIILFVATVGIEIDRLIKKYEKTSITRAAALGAAGSAAVESWCDILCRKFSEKAKEAGRSTKPRFSPGYGDLPLAMQREIFRVLTPEKRIGVTLSESLMMMPSKSVSAIVGITGEGEELDFL